MMVILLVLMIAVTFCSGQDNAKVTYEDECNKVGHTLTIKAEYTGNGIPSSVSWSYSGDVGSFLEILTSNCDVFGSVPVGFPDSSRLSYECVTTDPSLPPNIFKLKVSGLLSNETDKTWGATFTPPVGAAPAAVELGVPTICTSTTVPPTTSSTTSPTTSSTTTKSPDIPVVIIVPCVVVVILIICIIVCILLRKKSNRKKKHRADPENVQMPQVDINEVNIIVP